MSWDHEVARVFSANLKHCREHAGLSQEELSFRAGLHRTEISILERAGRIPRIDTLIKLANSIGISADALLEGIGWKAGTIDIGRFRIEDRAE